MKKRLCGDCAVEEGQLHQLGCDMEECPFCGGQLISCLCRYKALGLYDTILYSSDTWHIKPSTFSKGLTPEEESAWDNIITRKGRIPWIHYPLICSVCGKHYPDFFSVPDSEWQHYIPTSHQHDIICQNCYNSIKEKIDNNKK